MMIYLILVVIEFMIYI